MPYPIVPQLWNYDPYLTQAPELWRDLRALYTNPQQPQYAQDLSGNELHLSLTQTPMPALATTLYGRAWDVETGGTSLGYLTHPNHSLLQITGELTIAVVCIKDGASAQNAGIVSKYVGSGDNRGYVLANNEQGSQAFHYQLVVSSDGTSTNSQKVVSSNSVSAAELAYVVATYRPSTNLRINLNGTITTETSSIPAQIDANTAPLWIGHQFSTVSGNLNFDGKILFVAIAARAWTEDEEVAFIQDPFRIIRPSYENDLGYLFHTDAAGTTVPIMHNFYRMMRGGS